MVDEEKLEEQNKRLNRKVEKLMYLIHELKHMECTFEEFEVMFADMFPFYRDVEGYNPKLGHHAVTFLFDVVLVERVEEPLR